MPPAKPTINNQRHRQGDPERSPPREQGSMMGADEEEDADSDPE
jgi:hypothetical protein